MTDEEKYLFDLQGYLVIEQAIPTETVQRMNQWLDAKAETDAAWRGTPGNDKIPASVLTWGHDFRDLLDNERVLPLLIEMLGNKLHLDHDYAMFLTPGGDGLFLHGGGTPYDPSQYYHCIQGKIHCGLTVAVYALTDSPPGSGGFACIPGSHKSFFACPEDIAWMRRPSPIIQHVPVKAGDCILFTEALQHGTMPWKGPHIRRTIYLKYSPSHLSWTNTFYVPTEGIPEVMAIEAEFTERQRILLDPPGYFRHRKVRI